MKAKPSWHEFEMELDMKVALIITVETLRM
jgi:hypothetical protein